MRLHITLPTTPVQHMRLVNLYNTGRVTKSHLRLL